MCCCRSPREVVALFSPRAGSLKELPACACARLQIITELPPDHPVSANSATLKDTLGHTPLQVAVGAVVGIVTGYLTGLLFLL